MKFKAKTVDTFERMPKILGNNFSFKEHPISSNRFNEFFEQIKFRFRIFSEADCHRPRICRVADFFSDAIVFFCRKQRRRSFCSNGISSTANFQFVSSTCIADLQEVLHDSCYTSSFLLLATCK